MVCEMMQREVLIRMLSFCRFVLYIQLVCNFLQGAKYCLCVLATH